MLKVQETLIVYVCDYLDIQCPSGSTINLNHTNIKFRPTCSEGREADELTNTYCKHSDSFIHVRNTCNYRNSCSMKIDDCKYGNCGGGVLNEDPCEGTYKYERYVYDCLESEISQTTVNVCEGSYLNIQCPSDEIITIVSANYGRLDSTTCSKGWGHALSDIDCRAADSFQTVSDVCNDLNACTMEISNSVFGVDPCYGTYKYGSVVYDCLTPSQIRVDMCEGNNLIIQCPASNYIFIHAANFGRLDGTTCSKNRPQTQLSNTDCRAANSFRYASGTCNYQGDCTMEVSLSTFGVDPCEGTYKYGSVVYACLTSSLIRVDQCEGSNLKIQCPGSNKIFIHAANFGRLDGTTCSEKRPQKQLSNTDCRAANSFKYASDTCNYQNECTLPASRSSRHFSEPCRDTYKVLSVEYECFSYE